MTDRDEWLAWRRGGIGGSDIAAILGLSSFASPYTVWADKVGLLPPSEFQLGYGGVLELARRAEPGVDFEGHAVYPNDEFDIDYGSTEPLRHRPAVALRLDRGGPAFAWYVLMRRPDGSKKVHVLDREGVEYHHGFSKMQNGDLWKKSYDAAALKSVVLDMRRWLPQSSEMALAFASDESTVTVEQLADDPEAINTDAIDVGEATVVVEP